MARLQFGVNTSTRGAMTSRAAYKSVAQAAEKLGFGFISVNDHVVVPRDIGSRYPYSEDAKWAGAAGGHNFDVLAMLAFLAGCTERIQILSSVMVVPHRQPILTAKMLATIDVLIGWPSVRHNSKPLLPSLARKKIRFACLVNSEGLLLTDPGKMSLTRVVPLPVPSLFQIS